MGDCAVVIFHSRKRRDVSLGVYLHMHAGVVLYLLEKALPDMRTGDAEYSCARFIGHCHGFIPPNTGLGVSSLPGVASDPAAPRTPEHYRMLMAEARRFDSGGRGVFLVDVDRWRVRHAG